MKNYTKGNTNFVLFGIVAIIVVIIVAWQVYHTGDKSEDVIDKSRNYNTKLLDEIKNSDNPNAGLE